MILIINQQHNINHEKNHEIIELCAGEVHLWCVFPGQIQDDDILLEKYKSLLQEEETSRMDKFFFPEDKKYFLITRALVRATLSRYVALSPLDWRFRITSKGKPFIANESIETKTISFNLTHTEGLILLGISKNSTLGIDSEKISEKLDFLAIAQNSFADNEIAVLKNTSGRKQLELFFKYWTLKESYLKARGVGLSFPLNSLSFQFDSEGRISCQMDSQLQDVSSKWKFFQFKPTEEHIMSICMPHCETIDYKIQIKKTIPLVSEDNMETPIYLSS
jgi:4'-phosphopantetheinyl transferase